jgi:DNA-binding NtrC family response regulator
VSESAARTRVLLAEDEPTIAETLGDALGDAGYEVLAAPDSAAALAVLESGSPDIVVTDIRMPGAGGMAILERSVALDPTRPVIVITGYASVDQAVDAMSRGAAWYVQKPFDNLALIELVRRFSRARWIEAENRELRDRIARLSDIEGIVGRSPAMNDAIARLRTVAPTDATVLIEGESGTGKERFAMALHALSPRVDAPFIALSCAALPENLLETELFGHEKGAFTDAHREKKGRFELAEGGTLFLDDIDDMPAAVQVKLLRVLQERRFERVGAEKSRAADFRLIAATKEPLRELVRAGRFRDDLFYRIHVVPLRLPPVRERDGDVPLLCQALIQRHFARATPDAPLPYLRESTMTALERYPWPGNVRELENAIQRALALRGDALELDREHLLPADPRWRGANEVPETVRPLREVLKEREREHIAFALEQTGGHRTQSAALLGISRKVLWEKLKEHDLEES